MLRTRGQPAGPATVLDTQFLSSFYDFPEPEIQSLLVTPTVDIIRNLFSSLLEKGREFETLQAGKLKVDVELENVVRSSEAKVKVQRATVARHTKEVEELRIQLNEAERARETLSSELNQLRSETTSSSSETSLLRQRIATLEASNRDALSLVESKSSEKDRFAADLSEQHSKILSLRKEVSQLEEKCQSLENAASSQKFKEQSLQQEIELLKRNNEWNTNELQTRSQESAKFRKERNARITGLQRELEDAITNAESLKRSEAALRKRLDETQAKADEAFAKAASLREDMSRKEQDMNTKLESTKRLADLQAQNASTHKARLQEVQRQVDEIKESAADEIGRLQAEVETERSDKEQVEVRVAELELAIEQLEQNPTRFSRPSTPRRNGNTEPMTPTRIPITDTPSVIPGSLRKVVGGLSFTQLYANYTEVQQELEDERRRTQRLSTAMDELMTEMETRTPEIVELKADSERLEASVLNFSQMLDETKALRDQAVEETALYKGQADEALRENDVLRQQLRDLSAQLKILLVEIQSRDQGLGELSAQERFELERAARGELDADALEHMTSTGRLISERLVIFHNINDLQRKNEQLLKITRQLGEQMEGAEAQEKARQTAEYASENEELKRTLSRYRDELNATATQIDSYMKERDMFRRMLQHRGQLMPGTDLQSMFGESMGPPATPQRNGSIVPQTPRSKDIDDLNKLLKEQQSFFDQYRTESSTDRRTLKDQVDALTREKSNIQTELARLQSQLTLAGERYEMLQSNFTASRNENAEIQKRLQHLSENGAKQDLRIQQVAEELVEARSMADSLRNENANAKAEKELWKRIESRLTDDNKNLLDERSRLNKIVSDLQHLQNERQMTESESRTRLQARIERLESELIDTKRKLESESDANKQSSLRREFEESQNRTRIDDLMTSLGNLREELAGAKSTRDQLQSRVDELKIELRAAEERATALQPRPTARSGLHAGTNGAVNGRADELSDEQRLAVEIADLRRDLELAQNSLESVRVQADQYKAIAQTTEEELASLNETTEQFRSETDQSLADKAEEIKQLEQRVQDLGSELTTSNAELSELRSKADEYNRTLEEQRTIFEGELVHYRDDAERFAQEKTLYQADLKAQAEIAQQAQQSYEDELLKHADAAKALQIVRKDYNDQRSEVAGLKAEAEASRTQLEASEESWSEQRNQFETEMQTLKRRREDAEQQNKLLHQQLEAFSAELAALRASRKGTLADFGSADGTATSQTSTSNNMQEVIKFLRREKEIVDVQYEISLQDVKRLQQQLEYTTSQLEQTRIKLVEEQRQALEKLSGENSTSRLQQTINDLNVHREATVTLRNEARAAREKLDARTKEVERLTLELEPLKLRIGELEGELESKIEGMSSLQKDRDHWEERTRNIISKYDRVDPVELEELRKQLETLKADKDRLEAEQIPLKEQIEGIDSRIEAAVTASTATYNERLAKFREQAKDRNRMQNDKIRATAEELEQMRSDKDRIAAELEIAQASLEETKHALESAQTEAASVEGLRAELEQFQAQVEAGGNGTQEEDEQEEGQVDENAEQNPTKAVTSVEVSDAQARVMELEQEVQDLNTRIAELEAELATARTQAPETQPTEGAEETNAASSDAQIEATERLQQELSHAQQEVETLRSNAAAATTTVMDVPGDETEQSDPSTQEMAKLRQEMEEQHGLALKQMEEACNLKIEKMKANLGRQLREGREKIRESVVEELRAQHAAELQKLRDEHQTAVQELVAAHQSELERLSKETGGASETAIKSEPNEVSESQMMELVRTNPRMKQIISNNVRKHVAVETERLSKVISEKDAQLASAKSGGGNSTSASQSELESKLKAAQAEKEAAIKDAVAQAEMRVKVQLSMRDKLQAQIAAVRKAVKDTPAEAVSKVWEVAEKAKPAPKPTPAPQTTAAKPAAQGGLPVKPESTTATSFGQPSAPPPTPSGATSTTFGLPSKPPPTTAGADTASPNPKAAPFVPGAANAKDDSNNVSTTSTATNATKTLNASRGGSSLPRGNFGGRGGSALPRGGSANRGARGGRGGTAANAGQKRVNDGTGGGDDKRQRPAA